MFTFLFVTYALIHSEIVFDNKPVLVDELFNAIASVVIILRI